MPDFKDIVSFLSAKEYFESDCKIERVGSLGNLPKGALAFLSKPNSASLENLGNRSDVCVLTPYSDEFEYAFSHIVVENPRLAYAKICREFFAPKIEAVIQSSSLIHPSATIGKNVHIGHFSIIGAEVNIGDNTFIGNNVEIMNNVTVGAHCHIKSQAVIGQEGFGFEKDQDNNYFRLPHLGGVIIADYVEIGTHSTIACGTIDPTKIGEFTKIDDHVHVGHNTNIGPNNILAGGVVISGGVKTGSHVWFGPNSCMMQRLTFDDGCMIGVGAVMYMNGKKGVSYGVRPALPVNN